MTHTKDIGCTAYLYISRELREECLIIRQFDDKHSHVRSEELWLNYTQNRILNKNEQERVKQLQKNYTPNASIVRIMTQETGKAVRPKDIQNIRTKADIERRGGKAEIELVDVELARIQAADSDSSVCTNIVEGKLTGFCVATGAMKRAFAETPEVLFVDATYKVRYRSADVRFF